MLKLSKTAQLNNASKLSGIPIEVSARHAHLSSSDLETLFGKGYQLTKLKELSQKGEFAAGEQVAIKTDGGKFEKVRIIGPVRKKSQVEICKTDSFALKADVPVKLSGDLEEAGAVTLIGPRGRVDLAHGMIISKRHLHISVKQANDLDLKQNDSVSVKIPGERGLIFNEVAVRINENFSLALHIDTDEGNAAGIDRIGKGSLFA